MYIENAKLFLSDGSFCCCAKPYFLSCAKDKYVFGPGFRVLVPTRQRKGEFNLVIRASVWSDMTSYEKMFVGLSII